MKIEALPSTNLMSMINKNSEGQDFARLWLWTAEQKSNG
jgi:hypothetical protein